MDMKRMNRRGFQLNRFGMMASVMATVIALWHGLTALGDGETLQAAAMLALSTSMGVTVVWFELAVQRSIQLAIFERLNQIGEDVDELAVASETTEEITR